MAIHLHTDVTTNNSKSDFNVNKNCYNARNFAAMCEDVNIVELMLKEDSSRSILKILNSIKKKMTIWLANEDSEPLLIVPILN